MLAQHMTWFEYRDRVQDSLIILPTGSLEQHGPHLPLNVDVVIPTGLAGMVADRTPGIILPALAYGYKSQPTSGGGQQFPGTTSLDGHTLTLVVGDILREVYRDGGRKFLIVNGHYENAAFITEAVDIFIRNTAPDAKVVLLSWWDLISDETTQDIFKEAGFPGWDTEHAGITETSLMQYFAPELVREDKVIDDQSDRKPAYQVFPPPPDIIPASGVLYKATYASREIGERIAREVVDRVVEIVEREFQ